LTETVHHLHDLLQQEDEEEEPAKPEEDLEEEPATWTLAHFPRNN
jgi:hypothetical protein